MIFLLLICSYHLGVGLLHIWAVYRRVADLTEEILIIKDCHDGDTCLAQKSNGQHLTLRLFGIDAPELRQPFGMQARDVLREMTKGRAVKTQIVGRDPYGRFLAILEKVNQKMILDGWAFYYRGPTLSHEHSKELLKSETQAKNLKKGLWMNPPEEPRLYRKRLRLKAARLEHHGP